MKDIWTKTFQRFFDKMPKTTLAKKDLDQMKELLKNMVRMRIYL